MNRESEGYGRSFAKALIAVLLGMVAVAGAQTSVVYGPHIYVQSAQVLPVEHTGPESAVQLLQLGAVEPLSMAQGDFHETGISDLAVGYATSGGNLLAVHRGNLDAFAPQSQKSWEEIRAGIFPSPFLLQASLLPAPVRPDFLQAGNFSGQGHVDLLLAARGGSEIYILAGNGQGEFNRVLAIPISGTITTMAAGVVEPGSALMSVLVGVKRADSFSLQIYRGSAAGLVPVASLNTEGPPAQIALGNLSSGGETSAAVLVGGEVMLLDWDSEGAGPMLRPSGLSSSIPVQAMVVGRFLFDRSPQQQLALLSRDGTIQIAAHAGLDSHPWTAQETKEMLAQRGKSNPFVSSPASSVPEPWQIMETFSGAVPFTDLNHPPVLLRARISSRGPDDVMAINGETGQMTVISHPNLKPGAATYGPGEISVMPYTAGRPVASLAMRVNVDARPGLVMLLAGSIAPLISQPLPDPTFTVNTTTDLVSSNPNACLNNVAGQCSLREAVIEANATQGNDTIMVPAGMYQLTIPPNNQGNATGGHLDITDGVSIVGTANTDGTPGTIIEAGTNTSDGIDKVFSIAPPNFSTGVLGASFTASMSNLVCQFGLNNDPNDPAGGCFDADAGAAGTGSVALTNVAIQNNSTALTALNQSDGGGIAFFTEVNASGGATISQSILQGNLSTDVGGGIFVGSFVPLTLSNTQVINNKAVGSGTAQQGGGIALLGTSGATPDPQSAIHASVISGNQAGSQGGGIYSGTHLVIDTGTIITNNLATGSGAQTGGGLWSNLINESTQVTNATFTRNNAGGSGGAIQVDNSNSGNTLNIVFSRIAGNTAPIGNGLNNVAGTVTATDDWWGCISGPNSSPCDQVNGSNITFSPWITLSLAASPSTINNGSSSTLTVSLLQDSQGNSVALPNIRPILAVPQLSLPAPGGLPVPILVTWGNVMNGTISNTETFIQATTGTATATFTADAGGTGQATATVDSGSATASITIQGFTLTLDPASQNVLLGDIGNYTLTARSLGGFVGTITITCAVTPSGPVVTTCPSSLTITDPNQAVSAPVVVSTSVSNTVQNYTVSATGISGSLPPFTTSSGLVIVLPKITGLTPNSGHAGPSAGPSAGTSITITGTNLVSSLGPSTVTFNGDQFEGPVRAVTTSQSPTSIATQAPLGAVTGDVVVVARGNVPSNGFLFTVQDDALQISGTNCSNCQNQVTYFTIQQPQPPLYGYTIRPGDLLFFYQSQDANSTGGIVLCFAGSGLCDDDGKTVDRNGNPINADGIHGVAHARLVDLTLNAGSTLAQVSFTESGPAGNWNILYSAVQIVSTDGTVHPIFTNGANPNIFPFGTTGVTQRTWTIVHNQTW